MRGGESLWWRIVVIFSLVVVLAVTFLIFGPRPDGLTSSLDVSNLPLFNAIINGITTLLLITAFLFIRQKKVKLHRRTMLTAFGTSALFLMSYVTYHWFETRPKLYEGEWKAFYYFILFSHILLAAVILPMAMMTLYRGWNGYISKHRSLARITLPLWLYVSVTGVLIFLMLY